MIENDRGAAHRMGIRERKERQRAELRDRILAAAREIVARQGLAGLTMRGIAQAVEYSPAALYQHFASRDEIARDLCVQGFGELLDALRPAAGTADPLARIAALAHAYVGFGLRQPETYRLIFMEDPQILKAVFRPTTGSAAGPDAASVGAEAFMLLVRTFADLQAAGHLAADADPTVLAEVAWAGLHGIVSLKLTCPAFQGASPEVLTATLIRTLIDGLPGPRP